MPGLHARLLVAVGATTSYEIASHTVKLVQMRSVVAVGALISYSVEELQTRRGIQSLFDVDVGWAASNSMLELHRLMGSHTRSLVAVGDWASYSPATQFRMLAHFLFEVVVGGVCSNCALESQTDNGAQIRFDVAVGALNSYCKGVQTARVAHTRSDVGVGRSAMNCDRKSQAVSREQTRLEVVVGAKLSYSMVKLQSESGVHARFDVGVGATDS